MSCEYDNICHVLIFQRLVQTERKLSMAISIIFINCSFKHTFEIPMQ